MAHCFDRGGHQQHIVAPSRVKRLDATRVRHARADDLPALRSIASRTWGGTDYLPGVLEAWLADDAGELMVADGAAGVVGCARLTRLGDGEWWIEGVRVDADRLGEGIGRRLFADAIARADERQREEGGAGTVRFVCGERNAAALAIAVDLAARERARFARYTAPAGAGGGARELRTLGAADVKAAWDFIRSMPFAVTVHTAPHRPMYARDVDERRLDVLGATGRLAASHAADGDLRRIDGLLVVARRSSHSSPSCLDLAFLDAPPTLLAGLARATRDLAAARGAATVAVPLRVTDDRVDALRTAGWSRANPASGCSILFERAIGDAPTVAAR